MKQLRRLGVMCACVVTSLASTTANAILVPVFGGQAVYDSDLEITWLSDANAAVGSPYDTANPSTGRMNWVDANAWAESLVVEGFTDWRLPTTTFPDTGCDNDGSGNSINAGYNCTSSEMGNLFYDELGVTAGSSILSSTDPDLALFTNIQDFYYWSGTESATGDAWNFQMFDGKQTMNNLSSESHAWAVHTGNIGGAVVPIPAAVWLFGSGLLGLIGIARGKKAE